MFSAQQRDESPQSVDALQLDNIQQNIEDGALHREGHEKAPNTGLGHREVVWLVGDVWKQKNYIKNNVTK